MNTIALNNALEGIGIPTGPGSLFSVITGLFRFMELAEHEIETAETANPLKQPIIHDAFRYLRPGQEFKGLSEALYLDHCREIIARLIEAEEFPPGKRRDLINLGTRAECIIALMQASFAAPLAREYAGLYHKLFIQVFGEQPFSEIIEPSWPTEHNELEAELRRKLTRDRDDARKESSNGKRKART